jgi:hypothetical protein
MAKSNKLSKLVLNEYVDEQTMYNEYTKNNVIREYTNIFNEFSCVLMRSLHKTYLGREYINTAPQIVGHFSWCFNDVITKYKSLGFNFQSEILYDYFFKHASGHIYDNKKYDDDTIDFCCIYFNEIMNFNRIKTQSELILMIELYFKFEKSL